MADRRIYELTTKSAALGANDYFAIDNGTEAESKKLPTSYFTDQLADMQNVYGAKNLLPYPYTYTTKAENGLTFTDLGNGKVTVSGTATAETTFYLGNTNAFADKGAGTYILSGCPEGGDRPSGYFLEISGRATASDNWTTIATDIGAGATFTITTEMLSWVSIHVFIRVRSGKAISTPITYAPMLRLASIQDDTWVPYVPKNRQLLSHKDNGILGAKNLLPYPYNNTTLVEGGITWTDNGDGTITANGTANSSNGHFVIASYSDKKLSPKTTYIASMGVKGSLSTYYMRIYNGPRASFETLDVTDKEIVFTTPSVIDNDSGVNIQLLVISGTTVNNLVFKPMLRLASDSDNTYQPYSKTNKELTDAFKNQVANKDDEYSSSKAYAVGDHCIYNNVLYKCITACSAAAWSVNQTNFEATTLAESVGELNSALTYVTGTLANSATEKKIASYPSGFDISNAYISSCMVEVSNGVWAMLASDGSANAQLKSDGIYAFNSKSTWFSHSVKIVVGKLSN